MALNTLETAYVNGQIIDASHINELTLSLLGQFVGRDSNGVPTPNQSLGTLAIPWGNIYGTGLILDGLAVDTSQITSLPNRIVSGRTRNLSSMPDYLRANGAALEFDILGGTIDLVLSINNAAVSIASDLNKTGVVAAPSANNTADINDTDIVNDLYAGEDDYEIDEIILDAVGSEITSRVGQIVAFRTPTNEILQGRLRTATQLTNVFRGYYLDSSGNPIERDVLSNNDTITLMNIGWVFVEDNGTTVDISYRTPSISYNAPSSPQTGDYWFDISNQVWKRYSGTSWDIINRILIGQVVSDDTNTIASRSWDFSNQYRDLNNVQIEIDSSEIIKGNFNSSRCSVYGTELNIDLSKLTWNMTTDLETGLVEAADTLYYLYLSDEGQEIISDKKPYARPDLKGFYHPYHSYRCVGIAYNDASNDIAMVDEVKFVDFDLEKVAHLKDVKAPFTFGGTFTSGAWRTRDLNDIVTDSQFLTLASNQFQLIDGFYEIEYKAPADKVGNNQAAVRNITDSVFINTLLGSSLFTNTSNDGGTYSHGKGTFWVRDRKLYELQHQCSTTRATFGFGEVGNTGQNEIYSQVMIRKIK